VILLDLLQSVSFCLIAFFSPSVVLSAGDGPGHCIRLPKKAVSVLTIDPAATQMAVMGYFMMDVT
jgi:hypothetical protein